MRRNVILRESNALSSRTLSTLTPSMRPASRGRLSATGLCLVLAMLSWGPVEAQPGTPPFTGSAIVDPGAMGKRPASDPALGKVSSHLLAAREQLRRGQPLASVQRALPVVSWKQEKVEVEIRLDELKPALLTQMRQADLEIRYSSERHARIVGAVDPEHLDELAAFEEVATIHPLYGYRLLAGSVSNQADTSIRAAFARSTFGVDGTGVEVGVLSDSFHDVIGGTVTGSGCSATLTGSASQGSGDLPASVRMLDNGPGGGTDEGAGMAELIFDLVPGAALAFHTAGSSTAEFADGIDDLRTCGADVIVDDVLFFAEPMFQDGLVAQAAQAAFDAGVPYYSSAGNSGTFGVDEMFSDSDASDDTIFGDDFHDFGASDRFAEVTLPGGCGIIAVLQWNDPFGGTLGPGASNDLDFYACTSASPADCIFSSTDFQGCSFGGGAQGGDPFEFLFVTNTGGSPASIFFAVDHFCGSEDLHFRMAMFGSGCSVTAYTFEGGIFDQAQTYGHPAAEGADAVAAVFYGEIDSGGDVFSPLGQINVEPFSSLGGDIPFYFDGSGNPLAGAPVTRFKPQFAAPDGTNTTFFGSDIGFDSDSHPNFFGTSAAAPHAAAVAALMLDINPNLVPYGVRQVLTASAVDIQTTGVDDLSGEGLVDAFDAVQSLSPTGMDCVDHLDLEMQDIVGSQFFRACATITAGPAFTVQPTGDLTFRAGSTIVLEDGFSVGSGGSFTAEIDPNL